MKNVAAAIGLACFAVAGTARAETQCAAIAGGTPALEAVDAEMRLTFVRSVMRDQASRAEAWRWSWTGIGLGLSAGQFALIPIYPADKRVEQVFLGLAGLYIPLSVNVFPMHIRHYDEILERAAADAEVSQSHMMPCLVLEHAEELLLRTAKDEAELTGVFMHLTTFVLSGAYAAIIAVGFHDVAGTVLNGVGSVVVGELQILTTPTGAVKALVRYRRGDLGPLTAPFRVSWSVAPLGLAPGLSLVARF